MSLPTLWFCLVGVMLTVYVILDGFDLGVGAVHLFVAREERERRTVLRAIGPVWDGNEVWLLAAGGTLYFAFPMLYAVAFSGFYLPLIMVLWLLMLRGISIELRGHIDSPVWKPAWDVVFCGASALLALFFGIALGNVVRGVPMTASGYFFSPLWTDFRLGADRGILDWYTVLTGVAALLVLIQHGSLWLLLKTEGTVSSRAAWLADRVWWAVSGITLTLSLVSFVVQPKIRDAFGVRPWGVVFPLIALAGLVAVRRFRVKGADLPAFLASCTYILGMMTSAVFGLYPLVLPAGPDAGLSLTLTDVATSDYGLRVGLFWWIPGMLLVTAYFFHAYRSFAGKVRLQDEGYG